MPLSAHRTLLPLSAHRTLLPLSAHRTLLPLSAHRTLLPLSAHRTLLPLSAHRTLLPLSAHRTLLPAERAPHATAALRAALPDESVDWHTRRVGGIALRHGPHPSGYRNQTVHRPRVEGEARHDPEREVGVAQGYLPALTSPRDLGGCPAPGPEACNASLE